LPAPEAGISLSLRTTSGKALKDDKGWVLVGEGYTSDEDARAAGSRVLDVGLVTFTRLVVGVDFGRAITISGQFRSLGLQRAQELLSENRLLDDTYGLSVFRSDPKPKFVRWEHELIIGKDPETFKQTFLSAFAEWRPLSSRQRTSLILFLISYF